MHRLPNSPSTLERHHAYVREESSRLEALIQKVCLRHGDTRPELISVKALFEDLSAEMSSHMLKEEQESVRAMMNEHDAAGELMKKIRLLTGNYTPPENACPTSAQP